MIAFFKGHINRMLCQKYANYETFMRFVRTWEYRVLALIVLVSADVEELDQICYWVSGVGLSRSFNSLILMLLQKLWMMHIPELSHIGDLPGKEGRVCIITGPTSGIGKETAREMFRRGYHGTNHHGFLAHICITCILRGQIILLYQSMNISLSTAKQYIIYWKKMVHFIYVSAGLVQLSLRVEI